MNILKNRKVHKAFLWVILVLAVGVLLYSVWALVNQIEGLRLQGIRPMHFRRMHFRPANGQLTPDQIRSWMTFKYINVAFNLPQDFLQATLKITDKQYPNLTIDSLAKEQKQTSAAVLQKVTLAVQSYIYPAR